MFKYGMTCWVREWVSEDGEEEEWSYENTQWFDSKKEMKKYQKWAATCDEDYRYEFFKVKKWLD